MQRGAADSLAASTRPLIAAFGPDLSCAREGDGVRWSAAGHVAYVEPRDDGSLVARFTAPPVYDAARGVTAAAVYRPAGSGYALTATGCERMIEDAVAFFSGVREPRFIFVDVV